MASKHKVVAKTSKDVSCLALTFFYDYLESQGIPRKKIQENLNYSPEYLNDRLNWIDYRTFLEIENHLRLLFPEKRDLFYNVGLTFGTTKAFSFVKVLVRAVVSPQQIYMRIPNIVPRFLFRFVRPTFYKLSRRKLLAHYVFNEGYPPSDAFGETVRGLLTSVPVMIGSSPAEVRMKQFSEYEIYFDIELADRWMGLFEFIKRHFSRVVTLFKVRRKALGDAAVELEETNRLLQDKVQALTEAKLELDQKVKNLTILNSLNRVATSDLDLQRLLNSAVTVISTELEQTPSAVLIAEGHPPGLVVAASAGLDENQRAFLDTLANPATKVAKRAAHGAVTHLWVAKERFRVIPLTGRSSLFGALILGEKSSMFETELLNSMASQLGIAMENALSYSTINDLRENLELRVKERTAELEVARETLEHTVTRLERADRAKAEFVTNVSHEFKTPLTLIISPLEELEYSMAPQARDKLSVVRRNAHVLLQLVNELLDFARLDQGRMPINPEELDLTRCIEDVVVNLEPLAARKDISLIWHSHDEDILVTADAKLLRRVLVNLVANGIKYCDPGDTVALGAVVAPKWIEIDVSDDGPGIPEDELHKVFERFQRATDANDHIVEGSGIGLAIVKEIVELHRGSIELESTVGMGSVFRIFLPRNYVAERTREERTSSPGPPQEQEDLTDLFLAIPDAERILPSWSVEESSRSGLFEFKVLLVEDNTDMREFLSRLLGQHYNVLIAKNGRRGLEMTRNELPDVVVSDVMMPRMNGFEMCREIKLDHQTCNIPVILVTARHGSEAAVEGFDCGADDFVVKPFSPKELLARVRSQVRIRSLLSSVIRAEKQAAIGILSAGIAHEVLNPVNAVVNAVAPLRAICDRVASGQFSPDDNKVSSKLLGAIETSGRRINEIVSSILTFTRQEESGHSFKEARISDGIESAIAILRFRIQETISIHRDYRFNEPVLCYPELLNQALMNLIINAIDAVAPRGGNIWIAVDCAHEKVKVRVCDDGPGVPATLREKIFTPFYSTKPPGSGTGLGLAIVREIISLHHGVVAVESGPDRGCEFTISIPKIPIENEGDIE